MLEVPPLTLCEVLHPKAPGAKLGLVLTNLDFLSSLGLLQVGQFHFWPVLPATASRKAGGLRCATLRLGSNPIICDGPHCAEASECVCHKKTGSVE